MVRQLLSEVTECAKIKDMLKRKKIKKKKLKRPSIPGLGTTHPGGKYTLTQVDLSGERKVMLT